MLIEICTCSDGKKLFVGTEWMEMRSAGVGGDAHAAVYCARDGRR